MRRCLLLLVAVGASPALGAPVALTPRPPIALSVGDGAGPQALALADIDADGRADLLVIDRAHDALHVLLGAGDGTFGDPVDYPLDGTPTAVVVADMASPFSSDAAGDADGRVDVVVALEDGYAQILLGRGDGGFDPPEQDLSDVLFGFELIGVAAQDLDGNGRLDLVFLDSFDEVYFLCNEAGVFAPCATESVCTDGSGAVAFAVADVDADGRVDVAVLSADSRDLRIIPGRGGGSFDGGAIRVVDVPDDPAQEPVTMIAAGLDDIGGDELVVASAGPAATAVTVFAATADGVQGRPAAGAGTPLALAAADLDGDRILDLATASPAMPGLLVARGDGSTGLGIPTVPDGAAVLGPARAVVAGPVDGDARPDLVLLSAAGDAVWVALNAAGAVCAGDCDADGRVVINELLLGVNIAIGLQPVGQCPAFDADANLRVEINEMVGAVRAALEGCR